MLDFIYGFYLVGIMSYVFECYNLLPYGLYKISYYPSIVRFKEPCVPRCLGSPTFVPVKKVTRHRVFQTNSKQDFNVFDISYHKPLKQYLSICGINPYQEDRTSNIIVIAIMCGFISFFGPTSMQLYGAIRNKDFDNVIMNLPHILTVLVSVIKVLNIYSNKTLLRKLFNSLKEDWKLLESKNELQMLDKFTKHGNKLACLYRRTLLTALVIFLSLPLCNPVLDIIIPLNETRQRNNVFQVHYGFLDNEEHFYIVYVHLSLCAIFIVVTIISVDSLYITIIYHACGLFAVCGSQVQKTAENNFVEKNGTNISNTGYGAFKECVMMHYKCLQLYNILDKCCRNLYLITMMLNAIILSVTAVEVIMFLDRPEEIIRVIVYLIAQQFHLYMFSLPGQTLLDQSVELADKIYDSDWYKIPIKAQKVFYLMQVRSNKPCILTAAGIYEMNIESFGITVKACMSYFTMFLSLRE